MADWIDFSEIRRLVSLETVLLDMYQLGERLKRSGRKLIGPCPIHAGSDNPRSFQADLEKNVWYCHTGCRRGGNAIDFVAAIERLPIRDAALKLQARYLAANAGSPSPSVPPSASHGSRAPPAATTPSPPPAPAERVSIARSDEKSHASGDAESANPPLAIKLTLAHDHPHLLETRRLSLETVKRFGVGYCARGLLRGMIAIPIRDEDGELVAYCGRRLKSADIREHGKYRCPKGFRRELILYNLDRTKARAASEGLILVEGFFSVIALSERGIENAVASMGCSLSEAQADLLAEVTSHVAILYDGDDAGRGGSAQALELLEKRSVAATKILLPGGTEPEDHASRLIRWAVSGARLLSLREIAFEARPAKPPTEAPAG